MSTIVFQEMQSCLEPRLIIEPLVFKHKFTSPKSNPFPNNREEKIKDNNESLSGWSFLQSLTTPQTNAEKVYVHPLMKNSFTTLSKLSLDMCTESLGSETGNLTQSSYELSSLSLMREKDRYVRPSRPRKIAKKLGSRSYPPPLTSSHSVHVRSHRENGRLVIRATTKTSTNDFQTERRNGRLKISLLTEKLSIDGGDHGNAAYECVDGANESIGKVGSRIINKTNRCYGEESGKRGISSWGTFLMATS